MRKRFQNGRVVKNGRYWIGKWIEDGHDRSKVLGKVSMMTKSKAKEEMAEVVRPINESAETVVSRDITVKDFFENVFRFIDGNGSALRMNRERTASSGTSCVHSVHVDCHR